MDAQPQRLLFKHIIRKVFLEDWVLKLVALAITLALWFGVTGLSAPTTQRLPAIKLNLQNYSNSIEVTQQPKEGVDLVVTGDKRKLAQIEKDSLVLSIDVSEVMPGDRMLNLTPDTVSLSPLPTGVRLVEIQPHAIPIRIEAIEIAEVPVRAETYGAVPDGYEIYSTTVTPAKVRVRGPAAFIRTLVGVPTERIDIGNRTSDFVERQRQIGVSDPHASVLDVNVVDVTFRIGQKRIERVYAIPLGDGTARRAIVTLYGGQSQFEAVQPHDIHIEIEKNDAGQDTPRVVLPDSLNGVEIRSVKLRG
ncbi:MAG TPA: CdaR family protein [Pyrinomonadaceae bacterium]|nr:CdaR family protein [Pyrinomonadaceae bacterium]